MKKLKLLWMILKRTKATQILSGYIVFLFVSAAIIQLVEPDINHYGDALWYCYAVLSTAGFGDIVAITFIGKLVSVLVTIYTIFVVAIVTGVVVNYYGQIVEMQRRETAMMFLDKLDRLPEYLFSTFLLSNKDRHLLPAAAATKIHTNNFTG